MTWSGTMSRRSRSGGRRPGSGRRRTRRSSGAGSGVMTVGGQCWRRSAAAAAAVGRWQEVVLGPGLGFGAHLQAGRLAVPHRRVPLERVALYCRVCRGLRLLCLQTRLPARTTWRRGWSARWRRSWGESGSTCQRKRWVVPSVLMRSRDCCRWRLYVRALLFSLCLVADRC